MKDLSILILVTLLSIELSFSQIVYNSSDFANIGDSTHVSKSSTGLSGFDFVQTGTNHSWNYESLPYSTQGDIKWNDPSNAGYKATWCLTNLIIFGCNTQFANFTNLAFNNLDSLQYGSFEVSNVVEHYKKSNDNLLYKMLGGTLLIGGLPIIKISEINDADTVYNFPLEYNNIDNCSSDYTIKISGDSTKYVSYYKRYNHVEGWGSLATPFSTFDNVLKLKTTITKIDTLFLGGNAYQYIDTLVEFKWFDPAYKVPVLEVKANKVGQNIVTTGIVFIDSLRCVDPQAYFLYSPLVPYWDSFSGGVNISFSNYSSNADSVYWDFGDGSFSNDFNPQHTFNCPGNQQVSLVAISKICDPYRFDTITIPIIIQDTIGYFTHNVDTVLSEGGSIFLEGAWQTAPGVYHDTLTSVVYGCDSIINTTILPTAKIFNDSFLENIKVYPNPVSNEVIIELEGNKAELYFEILNNLGQVVIQGELEEKTTIKMIDLAPSIYLIRIENGKSSKVVKFIKQ